MPTWRVLNLRVCPDDTRYGRCPAVERAACARCVAPYATAFTVVVATTFIISRVRPLWRKPLFPFVCVSPYAFLPYTCTAAPSSSLFQTLRTILGVLISGLNIARTRQRALPRLSPFTRGFLWLWTFYVVTSALVVPCGPSSTLRRPSTRRAIIPLPLVAPLPSLCLVDVYRAFALAFRCTFIALLPLRFRFTGCWFCTTRVYGFERALPSAFVDRCRVPPPPLRFAFAFYVACPAFVGFATPLTHTAVIRYRLPAPPLIPVAAIAGRAYDSCVCL